MLLRKSKSKLSKSALFRRRVRKLILLKYGSLDRFYLDTAFSKEHFSEMLRGSSCSLNTLTKLANALDVEVRDFFVFPEITERDRAIKLLRTATPEMLRRVIHDLSRE